MTYHVFLHPKADKSLHKLGADLRERKKNKIKNSRFYKIRVGDYRIIYEIWHEEQKIVVIFIGHRSKVYDVFDKLL
jgi:mRNA interferase RelE/StbE